MAGENAEILRRAYEALNEGDVVQALGVLADDAEWVEHSDLPEADVYRGVAAIRPFLERYLESWESFRQETERLMEAGDMVGVFLHLNATGRGSGIEVEARYVHVWTMRGGKGVRVDAYADRAAALELLEARARSQP